MDSSRRPPRRPERSLRRGWLAVALVLVGAATGYASPGEPRVVRVEYPLFFVDRGSKQGVTVGDTVVVRRDGKPILAGDVVEVQGSQSTASVRRDAKKVLPREGDVVEFRRHVVAPAAPAPPKTVTPEVLVPLAMPAPRSAASSANVYHGRLRFSGVTDWDPSHRTNYQAYRAGFNGSLDRMRGGAWSLTWYSRLSYRTGPGARSALDYHDAHVDLQRLALEGKVGNGLLRVGRFLPRETPSVGYLDGLQAEHAVAGPWRVGNTAGFRPSRVSLDFSADEFLDTIYSTLEIGQRRRFFYSATVAAHAAMFKGGLDRTAVFTEQQMDFGPKLNLIASTETDFDLGSGTKPWSGARWTRVNTTAWMPLFAFLTVRGGVDHYQQTNSKADIAAYDIPPDQPLDPGYWRYWFGGAQDLVWNWQADGEVSFLDAPDDRSPAHWRAGLSHAGLPWNPVARVAGNVYNIHEMRGNNLGGQGYVNVPVLSGRLNLNLAVNGRTFRVNDPLNLGTFGPSHGWKATDYSVRADGYLGRAWSFYAGYTHTFAVFVVNNLVDFGVDYRW